MTDESAIDLAFLVTTPPNAGYLGQEIFDLVVSAGVFDQRILVVFVSDGLLHLPENSGEGGRKSLSKLWQSAGFFGVERFVAVTDLASEWPPVLWAESPLQPQVDTVTAAELSTLLAPIPQVTVL